MSVFGTITTRRVVEAGVVEFLADWTPVYLREIERQAGLPAGVLPDPRTYTRNPRAPEKWPAHDVPAIVVVSSGAANRARRDGSVWSAPWTVGVSAIVQPGPDATLEEVGDLVGWYVAAVRSAVLQHPSLGGVGRVYEWLFEDYDRVAVADARTLGIGQVGFTAEVEALDAGLGPAALPTDPDAVPEDDPQIEQVVVDVVPSPLAPETED